MSTPRPAPRVILRSSWQMQQQQQQKQWAGQSPGKPGRDRDYTECRNEIPQDDDQVEITTSIFSKIDLGIVGIPQEAVLQDKMQMKSISETKRKLEQSKVDLGENSNQENCVYFKEIAERFMTRTMSNLLNYDRCLKSFHVQQVWM